MVKRALARAGLVACAFAIWAGSNSAAAQAQAAAQPPAATIASEIFAQKNLLADPVLSPDGHKLVTRIYRGGEELLGIQDLVTGKLKVMGSPPKGEISWYRWAGNDRILISIATTVDFFGEEAQATRLLAYDVSTEAARFIGSMNQGLEGDDILYVDKSGEWLLLSFQKTVFDWPSVHRIDLATNKMKQVVSDQQEVWEWFADERGVVRFGVGASQDSIFMVYRKSEEDRFRRVGKARFGDRKAGLALLKFVVDTDEGFVISNEKTGRDAVYKYNFATGEMGEAVFEHPTNDVTDYSLSDGGKTLSAVWYTDDRDRVLWFDPVLKKHQADIDEALKGRMNWIVSRSEDDKWMLVWTGASNDPGSYYLYDTEQGVMKRVGKLNDKLDRNRLAQTTYVKYSARDGTEIPAYLTLPPGKSKDLPLIIMPHGGPYGVRDSLEYDSRVQFLVNRGYAVLQPNFRGSAGYGEEFYKLGEGQWGRRMQDDLDDGMDWLTKSGTVDAKRVCIVGSSYGGYAALWGATRNPERYRCAVSFAGVTDLRRQLRYSSDFFVKRRYAREWKRKVQGDKDFDLDSVSPLKHVADLKVPVMVIHGDDDQIVPVKQSSLYGQALQKAGKVHEFHIFQGEGHGLSSEANEKEWLDRLERFLAKHNPAG